MAENKEVAVQKSFQERIKDRIKDDVGKLMTDEELSSIVNRSVEDIFFGNRRVERTGSFNRGDFTDAPPFIHELLHELLVVKLTEQVGKWLKAHEKEVSEIIDNVIERGIASAVIKSFEDKLNFDLMNFAERIQNNLVR